MSKAPKISLIDPTLPRVELKLGKETYFLVFTFKALAIAQKGLRDIGVEVNLLHALDLSNMDAEKLIPLLYAALITHQPKITPAEVTELVTFKNLGTIFEKIAEAYGASLADPSDEDVKADPTRAE
jgi:hypothetical protein